MTDDMARAVGEASLLPITTYNPAEDLAIELRGLDAVSRRDFEIRHRSIPEGRRRQLLLIGHNLTIPHHIAIGYGMSISILRRQPVGHNPALPETRTTELPTQPDEGHPFATDRYWVRQRHYQRCGWRISETVNRDFEAATVLTKKPRAETM
jgi:hypothetical protein